MEHNTNYLPTATLAFCTKDDFQNQWNDLFHFRAPTVAEYSKIVLRSCESKYLRWQHSAAEQMAKDGRNLICWRMAFPVVACSKVQLANVTAGVLSFRIVTQVPTHSYCEEFFAFFSCSHSEQMTYLLGMFHQKAMERIIEFAPTLVQKSLIPIPKKPHITLKQLSSAKLEAYYTESDEIIISTPGPELESGDEEDEEKKKEKEREKEKEKEKVSGRPHPLAVLSRKNSSQVDISAGVSAGSEIPLVDRTRPVSPFSETDGNGGLYFKHRVLSPNGSIRTRSESEKSSNLFVVPSTQTSNGDTNTIPTSNNSSINPSTPSNNSTLIPSINSNNSSTTASTSNSTNHDNNNNLAICNNNSTDNNNTTNNTQSIRNDNRKSNGSVEGGSGDDVNSVMSDKNNSSTVRPITPESTHSNTPNSTIFSGSNLMIRSPTPTSEANSAHEMTVDWEDVSEQLRLAIEEAMVDKKPRKNKRMGGRWTRYSGSVHSWEEEKVNNLPTQFNFSGFAMTLTSHDAHITRAKAEEFYHKATAALFSYDPNKDPQVVVVHLLHDDMREWIRKHFNLLVGLLGAILLTFPFFIWGLAAHNRTDNITFYWVAVFTGLIFSVSLCLVLCIITDRLLFNRSLDQHSHDVEQQTTTTNLKP